MTTTIDQATRMLREAQERIHDADLLSQNIQRRSDSNAILRVLGFEILLKCALLLAESTPARSHAYKDLWDDLPPDVQEVILSVARERMPGHADLSDLPKLLNSYEHVFKKARYYYEFYENYSLREQKELGEFWEQLGAPIDEAEVRYYPNELTSLIYGLAHFIEGKLALHQLDDSGS